MGLGFRVLWFMVYGLGLRVWVFVFILVLGFWVYVLGFRVNV